jgi:hypothetical protein
MLEMNALSSGQKPEQSNLSPHVSQSSPALGAPPFSQVPLQPIFPPHAPHDWPKLLGCVV